MTKLLALVISMLIHSGVAAADNDSGFWLALSHGGPLSEHAGYGVDAHIRYFDRSGGFNQYLLRPYLSYALSPATSFGFGYTRVHTDRPGRDVKEDRFWQQLTWKKALGDRRSLSTRARLMQRWRNTGADSALTLRTMVKITQGWGRGGNTFSVALEPFFETRDTDWGASTGLGQSRLTATMGFRPMDNIQIEAGYLHQRVHRNHAEDLVNHMVFVSLAHR